MARACAPPTVAAYAPTSPAAAASRAAEREELAATAPAAAATTPVAAAASRGSRGVAPSTSRWETVVVTPMWAVTTAACGSARAAPCAPEPISTSSPRQAAMLGRAGGRLLEQQVVGPDGRGERREDLQRAGAVGGDGDPRRGGGEAGRPARARSRARPGRTGSAGVGRSTASTSRSA